MPVMLLQQIDPVLSYSMRKRRPLYPVVMPLAAIRPAHPGKADPVESRFTYSLDALPGYCLRPHARVLLDDGEQKSALFR